MPILKTGGFRPREDVENTIAFNLSLAETMERVGKERGLSDHYIRAKVTPILSEVADLREALQ